MTARWIWYPQKAARNFAKHGVRFEAAVEALLDPLHVVAQDGYPGSPSNRSSRPGRQAVGKGRSMRRVETEPSPGQRLVALEALAALPDDAIDFSGIPEIMESKGFVRGHRSVTPLHEVVLTIDADVVEYFERDGAGREARMAEVLRHWVAARKRETA